MKNILLLAHADAGQEARLQVALDLTRALNGHLRCVDITMLPRTIADYAALGAEAVGLSTEHDTESRNRRRLENRLAREEVAFDWVEVIGDPGPCLIEQARLADLIIVNRALDHAMFPDMIDIAGEVIVRANVPLLAVPETATGFRIDGHALVAWDGSLDAEAALRAALPLLQMARKVTLLCVEDGSIDVPVEDAARYLSRHGVEPMVIVEKILMDSAGTVILATTINQHVDYAVMGGFGHARWLEQMFGGATRRMLKESPVPVLLAHRT